VVKFKHVLALTLSLSSGAALADYNTLIVLGDSLSDTGNGAAITGGVAPGTPTGRASNGPVVVEYLAAQLGISGFRASALGGTNHAVFGATTGVANFSYLSDQPTGASGFPALATTGLQSQLANVSIPFNPSSTLFTIWGGANDIFLADINGDDLALAAGAAVQNLVGLMAGALGLGAQHLLIVGMPDLGLSPLAIERGPLAQAGLSLLAGQFNDALEMAVDQLAMASGARFMFFDPTEISALIVADPGALGFSNITDQCILSPTALATNCAGYAFIDEVHPSTAVHALFAAGMLAAIDEPATGSLLIFSAAMLLAASRRRVAVKPVL